MLEVLGGGLLLVGLVYAEKQGWVDVEKADFIVMMGMATGVGVSLYFFLKQLPILFL
ncbi:hypothetical protein HNQ34_002317 [Anoxybacillus tepidamans]|uniref:Uncharacterized protein n=1 Tax=Anoxybacteroides tepidamans TaxID=265948 RepID=A0A7W8IRC5_9BACL|nr:hypothetical protein [Anoxybacillus tepidamans]MBB5325217.1 hypothetical protein [Anoxybacillus tepidamans]